MNSVTETHTKVIAYKNIITHSMEQSPSEANNLSNSQKFFFPHFMEPKFLLPGLPEPTNGPYPNSFGIL